MVRMSFVINLGLDDELPMMMFANVSLLYPLDYVFSRSGKKLKVTEERVHQLVQRAVNDVRRALKLLRVKLEGYLDFRVLVVDTLCREYGFVCTTGSTHNILREEVEDVVEQPTRALSSDIRRAWLRSTAPQ